MLTSSFFTAVHESLLSRNEEKPVALLVHSSVIRLALCGFRINPYSLVVVVAGA